MVNNIPYDVGRALTNFDITIHITGRAMPGVKCEWQRDCDGRRQLLRSSATTLFILPLVEHITRIGAHTPIVVFGGEQNNSSCECICAEILSDFREINK